MANGTVQVIVDGVTFEGRVENGTALVDLTGLSGGMKVAEIRFITTDNYNNNALATASFTVLKANTTIDVTFTNPKHVGDNVTVNLVLNEKVNGTVTLTVDNENYTVTIVNGIGSYVLKDLINTFSRCFKCFSSTIYLISLVVFLSCFL